MTKTELIAKIATMADYSKKDAEKAVNAVLEGVTSALADGEKVAITGFGTFEVRNRPARTGLNPRTKEKMEIPASKAPAFKAGKALKEAIK